MLTGAIKSECRGLLGPIIARNVDPTVMPVIDLSVVPTAGNIDPVVLPLEVCN